MRCSRWLVGTITMISVLAVGTSTAVAKPPPDKGPAGGGVDVALNAPDTATTGEQFEYVASVSAGKAALDDVRLSDTLPPSLQYVSATPNQGTCSESGGTVTCDLGRLERRAQATVRILVSAHSEGIVTNTVEVTAMGDRGEMTGAASVSTTIAAPPPPDGSGLRSVYARDPGPALVGAPLTYRAQVTNDGDPVSLIVYVGASDNWTLGHPVIESFRSSQGTCSLAPSARPDVFGFPLPTPLSAFPECDLGVLGTGETVELVAVVRTNHPTTEQYPLYTGMGTQLGPRHFLWLGGDQTVVTTGNAVADCWFTGTGTYTNVPAYVDCASAP